MLRACALRLLRSPRRYDPILEELACQRVEAMLREHGGDRDHSTEEWVNFEQQFLTSIERLPLNSFCTWKVTRETMFVGNTRYLLAELRYLRATSTARRWKRELRSLGIGGGERCIFLPSSDGNTIHHSFQLAKFEHSINSRLSDFDLIVEFGAGFGSMCNLVHQKGFQGRYVIIDLPTLHLLQTYVLTTAGLRVCRDLPDDRSEPDHGIYLFSEVARAASFLAQFGGRKAFIASWSLSETPIHIREEMGTLFPMFEAMLIAFQRSFSGIDNLEYFSKLCETSNDLDWSTEPLNHLPGNYLLTGIRRAESSP